MSGFSVETQQLRQYTACRRYGYGYDHNRGGHIDAQVEGYCSQPVRDYMNVRAGFCMIHDGKGRQHWREEESHSIIKCRIGALIVRNMRAQCIVYRVKGVKKRPSRLRIGNLCIPDLPEMLNLMIKFRAERGSGHKTSASARGAVPVCAGTRGEVIIRHGSRLYRQIR